MTSGDAYEKVRAALRGELQKNFGRIREIEIGLGRHEGYLSKFCRGDSSIPFEILLKSLELLNADPAKFFSHALGATFDSSHYLHAIAAPEPERALSRLIKTTSQLACEMEDTAPADLFDSSWDDSPKKTALLVEAVLRCNDTEQRRRLRTARKYHSAGFVDAYLTGLLKSSHDRPKAVAKHAEVVGSEIVPLLVDASAAQRLALCLRAIGILCFARHRTGQYGQSAAGLAFALDISRRFRLTKVTGELLRYGAYTLTDHGRFRQSLQLLGEAMVIFEDLDESTEVAKLLVHRGLTYNLLDDHLAAAKVLRKALRRFPEDDPSVKIYRLTAFQNLSTVYDQVGDLGSAEEWLQRALDATQGQRDLTRAKFIWQAGGFARQRDEPLRARELFEEALEMMIESEARESLMVALDLTRVLLVLGELQKATELAQSMARLIGAEGQGELEKGTLVELIRAAIEGRLSMALVDRLQRGVKERSAAV